MNKWEIEIERIKHDDCYRGLASPTSLPQDHFSRIPKFPNLTIFFWVKIKPFPIFLLVKIKPLQIFLLVKIKSLQIFLLVKSNHTQSSYGWRLNIFNKWFVVYNNGSLKSSSIQYAHTNIVSRIWSIWLKKDFEEIYFQSRILNDLKI